MKTGICAFGGYRFFAFFTLFLHTKYCDEPKFSYRLRYCIFILQSAKIINRLKLKDFSRFC